MLTRSKSKKLREFKLCNIHKVKMAANKGDNGGNEMEFEIINQMGEIGIWEESTDNEIGTVSSEARGRGEEDVCNETQQTLINSDIAMLMKQLSQQMIVNWQKPLNK